MVGKEPDGDSVRFGADDLDLWSGSATVIASRGRPAPVRANTVTNATAPEIRSAVLTGGEKNGCPVSFVLLQADAAVA